MADGAFEKLYVYHAFLRVTLPPYVHGDLRPHLVHLCCSPSLIGYRCVNQSCFKQIVTSLCNVGNVEA